MKAVKKKSGNKGCPMKTKYKLLQWVFVLMCVMGLALGYQANAQTYQKYKETDTTHMREWLSFRPQMSSNNDSRFTNVKFKADNLPFFCKIEHKIEVKSRIPFRFRIGDRNYVNMLENKK